MTIKKVVSIKSQGYAQAVAGDTITDVARWCLANVIGFPIKADVPSEAREQLYQGYKMRRNEVYKPAKTLIDSEREWLVTVDLAYSFDSVHFGKLKNDQPKLHSAIKEVRIATDSYCSKNYSRLLAKGLELQNEGTKRPPRTAKTFLEQVSHAFDTLDARANLRAKESPEERERYIKAVQAFNRVWLAKD